MLIQDLQYIENVDCANEVEGGFKEELGWWASNGGNLGVSSAASDALGPNTFTATGTETNAIKGLGSSSRAYSFAWAG